MRLIILKALIYRIIIVITQFVFLWLYTGDVSFAIDIAIIFGFLATIEYVTLEKLWERLVKR